MSDILPLLGALARSVAALRKALESNELTALEPVLAEVQSYLDKVNAFPGGTQGLQQAIAQLAEPTRSETQQLLEQAKLDHQINSQLIRLAINAMLPCKPTPRNPRRQPLIPAKAVSPWSTLGNCWANSEARLQSSMARIAITACV